MYFFLAAPRALASDMPPPNPEAVACANANKTQMSRDKTPEENYRIALDVIRCDQEAPAPPPTDVVGPPVEDLSRASGARVVERAEEQNFTERFGEAQMDLVYGPSIHGVTNVQDKMLSLRSSTLTMADAGVTLVAHELLHVANADKSLPFLEAFDAAVEKRQAEIAADNARVAEEMAVWRKWDKRSWWYKLNNSEERPQKPRPINWEALPEDPAKEAARLQSIREERDAYQFAHRLSYRLGIPCDGDYSNLVSKAVPDDPDCHPAFTDGEIEEQMRRSRGYGELFSPEWEKRRFVPGYRSEVSGEVDDPNRAVTEVFNAQDDADGIIEGAPATEPGTTDENGVYTVTWEDIDPSRSVTEVFNAQSDEDGIVEGVPATEPGTTDENGIYTVTWDDIDPNRAVTEVFNAEGDEDGIIEGVPESEPGTTDENGVYTVAWEDIAAGVAADTGFTAQGDDQPVEEGVVQGEPASEPGTTDENGVYTVEWEDIAPADPVAEVFNAEGDADGIIEGVPESEPGTTDESGVHTVAWEEIAPQVEEETGFSAEPEPGVVTGEPITEEPLPVGEDMIPAVVAASEDTYTSEDG